MQTASRGVKILMFRIHALKALDAVDALKRRSPSPASMRFSKQIQAFLKQKHRAQEGRSMNHQNPVPLSLDAAECLVSNKRQHERASAPSHSQEVLTVNAIFLQSRTTWKSSCELPVPSKPSFASAGLEQRTWPTTFYVSRKAEYVGCVDQTLPRFPRF